MARTSSTPDVPSNIVQALRYGPSTQQAMQKSQYLTEALRSLQETGGQDIKSGFELAAKLGAAYLLNKGVKKANTATLAALNTERAAKIAKAKGGVGIGLPEEPPVTQAPPPPVTQPPAQPPTMAAPKPAPVEAKPLGPAVSPEDRLELGRMVWGEARGEPKEGQIAAAAVALNRARERGQPVSKVVSAPHQFDGYNARSRGLGEADLGPVLANIDPLLRGEMPDPTGGADHFYNPAMANPGWGQGKPGQMIGQHRFLNLEQGREPAPPMQAAARPPPQSLDQPGPIADQSFQVASAGPLQPGMIPSAPPPPGVGGAPAAPSVPQAGQAAGAASSMRYWKPTGAQVQYLNSLLDSSDYAEQEQGIALAQQWRAKMAEPVSMEQVTVNGVPMFYDPRDPQGTMQAAQVPGSLMNQTRRAEDLGISAPAGTILSASPLGKLDTVIKPETGQQVVSGAGQPYAEAPVSGGSKDPLSPQNRLEGLKSFRGELKPILDAATALKRNVDAVRTGYQQQNGSGDIAMVNGIQKLIDEGVVREGDVALQLKSQGIEGGIAGAMAFLQSSGKFSPEIRSKILGTANQLYGSLNTTYRERGLAYKGIVERTYGAGAFDDVVPPETISALEWSGKPPAGPGGGPAPARPVATQMQQQAYQALQKAGKLDMNAPPGSERRPFAPADAATMQALDKPENRGKFLITPEGKLVVIE